MASHYRFHQTSSFRDFLRELNASRVDWEPSREFAIRRYGIGNGNTTPYNDETGKMIRGEIWQNTVGNSSQKPAKKIGAEILTRRQIVLDPYIAERDSAYNYKLRWNDGSVDESVDEMECEELDAAVNNRPLSEIDQIMRLDEELWVLEHKSGRHGDPISRSRLRALDLIGRRNRLKISYAIVTPSDSVAWHTDNLRRERYKKYSDLGIMVASLKTTVPEYIEFVHGLFGINEST